MYDGELDNIVGMLHMKLVARELSRGPLDRDMLIELARAREAYFVPEGTSLNTQLLNFQRRNAASLWSSMSMETCRDWSRSRTSSRRSSASSRRIPPT